MIIAIPVENGQLAVHFGRCRHVMLFNIDPVSQEIEDEKMMEMPVHQPGLFPQWLAQQGATVVIAGGMGHKALLLFEQAEIRVVLGILSQTPQQLVQAFLNDQLSAGPNSCTHGPDHVCDH